MRLGLPELLIILFIVLLIFGAGRLPTLAASIRKAIDSFRQGIAGTQGEVGGEPGASARHRSRTRTRQPKDTKPTES